MLLEEGGGGWCVGCAVFCSGVLCCDVLRASFSHVFLGLVTAASRDVVRVGVLYVGVERL